MNVLSSMRVGVLLVQPSCYPDIADGCVPWNQFAIVRPME
jgi:hypothetical protein